MPYKSPSNLSDINQKNPNDQLNDGRNNDNLMINNNITPSTMINAHDRKYKTEKRIYREKDEFYYNMQNGPVDFNQNTGGNKGLGDSSSGEENDGGENEIKIENAENMRNNYGISSKNKNYRNFQMNEDINNNNYYSDEDNYGDNDNRIMNNAKRGNIDNNRQRGKNFNDNFNESNRISNNYYK